MKLLAKQVGSQLIAVAYNLGPAELNLLQTLAEKESLFPVEAMHPGGTVFKQTDPARVDIRSAGLPGLNTVNLVQVKATTELNRVLFQAAALLYVHRSVIGARERLNRGLPFQDMIYAEKLVQAKALASGEVSEQDAGPYVVMDAAQNGISRTEAAANIIDAAQRLSAQLVLSEDKRLTLQKQAYDVHGPEAYAEFMVTVRDAFA